MPRESSGEQDVLRMNNELGCFYKTVRLYKVVTKKEVCAKARLSRQYLTRIEDCTDFFSISRGMNEKMQKALKILFENNPSLIQDFDQKKEEFINACLYVKNQQAIELYQQIDEMKKRIENSVRFPEYLLLRFIYAVLFDQKDPELDAIQLILKKINRHLDLISRQRYGLITGIYEMKKGHLDAAYEALCQARQLGNDERLQSMIVYSLGLLALKRNNSLEALRYTMKARELFDSTCNYKRSIQCLSHLALIWMHLREYEGAIQLCEEAIQAAYSLDYSAVLGLNFRYLSWIALQQDDYFHTLSFAQKAAQYGETCSKMCFYASFACWKQGLNAEGNRWIASGLNHSIQGPSLSVKLLRQLRRLNRDPEAIEAVLLNMMEAVQKTAVIDHDLLRLIYHELALFYKSHSDYKSAVEFYERYLQL